MEEEAGQQWETAPHTHTHRWRGRDKTLSNSSGKGLIGLAQTAVPHEATWGSVEQKIKVDQVEKKN